ncbi:DNRLRE domain-containing protein [Trichloromonas acetexigens]|uniref:DNRLRE domain-containing protein n=1 Tax=Trichloromonas acetexigens TaxID=38815 RepID=A0A550J6T2_9BACT|nr:DNRLRE domain-containing protein [Desulfuromonas acetexigens]TRO78907.1 DNRLRE domain-containing protein [Desulfuromonas acetexigens]
MRHLMTVLAVALFTTLSFSTAQALTLTAAKDSYIESGLPSTNFGTAPVDLIKRQDNTVWTRISYFGFDLSSLSHTAIADATFSLNFIDSARGITSDTINYSFELFGLTNESLDGWGENSITWDNSPSRVYTNADGLASLGTFSLTGKGLGAFDFTSQAFVDFLNSDTNDIATLVLARTTNQIGDNNYIHAVASRENTAVAGPRLAVTPIPEPSTLLLLGAGLVGIGLIGRRKRN